MKQRNSSFELMRIIAMFMIILGHCTLATAQNTEPYLGALDCLGWGIKAFTVCAVNLFFMLTGYFLNSANNGISKSLRVWMKTIVYSAMLYIIVAMVTSSFSVKECVGYFTPVFTKKYWYIQTYIVIAFIAPYIVRALEVLNSRRLLFLIVILLLFFSIHQTFGKVMYTLDQTQGYGFIWGCVMLIVGYSLNRVSSYIWKLPAGLYLFGYVNISIAIFISNVLIVRFNIAGGVSSRENFYAYNSVTVLLQSVWLFCFFIKLSYKKWANSVINFLSKNVLAGYLISAHPLLLYPLWTEYFQMNRYSNNVGIYFGLSIVYTTIVLLVCIAIDKVVDGIIRRCGIEGVLDGLDKLYKRMLEQ